MFQEIYDVVEAGKSVGQDVWENRLVIVSVALWPDTWRRLTGRPQRVGPQVVQVRSGAANPDGTLDKASTLTRHKDNAFNESLKRPSSATPTVRLCVCNAH